MSTTVDAAVAGAVRAAAEALAEPAQVYDPLLDRIGDARFALLGEASHGTPEFYHERALISPRVGFYGRDLYSLRASMAAVLRYLEQVDPPAAERARACYACFDRFDEDPRDYGFLAGTGITQSCKDQVVVQLAEMVRRAADESELAGGAAEDEVFDAVQNARVV